MVSDTWCKYGLCGLLTALLWLFAGGSGAAGTPPRVALLLDAESDACGYGAALKQGLQRAQADFGAQGDVLVLQPGQENATFQRVARQGYDLVLVPGARLHFLLYNNAGNFPRMKFGAIDGEVKAPNILSATFAEAESAFLAGAAAGMLTAKTGLPGITPEHSIGWVGATDSWEARVALGGFTSGARLTLSDVQVESVFTGDADAEKARQATLDLYARGVDVVAVGDSRLHEAALCAAKEKKRYMIGMDAPQGDLSGRVLTTQYKALDKVVYAMVSAVADGSFQGGQTLPQRLANGGVGVTGMDALQRALGNSFPADIPKRLDELNMELRRGGIKVETTPGGSSCPCSKRRL